jgi:hypothetical protein
VDHAEQIVEDQITSSRRRVIEMFVQRLDHKAMHEIGLPIVSSQA